MYWVLQLKACLEFKRSFQQSEKNGSDFMEVDTEIELMIIWTFTETM